MHPVWSVNGWLQKHVKTHSEGHDLARTGNEIIHKANKWNPALAAACEAWKNINYEFKSVDTLDSQMQ